MKLTLILLLLFFPYIALSPASGSADSGESEIIEAVFRHQMKHCYRERFPKLYFLSNQGQDLSDSFMGRFDGYEVRKRSQMRRLAGKETGQRGILLSIRNITRISDVKAEVSASCGAAPLDAYAYVYRVVRKKDRWVVQRVKLTGVS